MNYIKAGAGQKPSPPRHIQGQSQQSERMAYKHTESPPSPLICVDSICTLLFSMELVKKIKLVHSLHVA